MELLAVNIGFQNLINTLSSSTINSVFIGNIQTLGMGQANTISSIQFKAPDNQQL